MSVDLRKKLNVPPGVLKQWTDAVEELPIVTREELWKRDAQRIKQVSPGVYQVGGEERDES